MLNWNMPASRPRSWGGEISEMYSGEATVAIPTPKPPMNRASMKKYFSGAMPEPTAETKYSTPIHRSVFLRPYRSVGQPPNKAPKTVPHSAALIHSPCMTPSRRHSDWIFCSAPEITIVSNPNKKPASAAVTAHVNKYPRWLADNGRWFILSPRSVRGASAFTLWPNSLPDTPWPG